MPLSLWQSCLSYLQDELPSQQFNTWIRPLKAAEEGQVLSLTAPNRFVKDWVKDKYLNRIHELMVEANGGPGVNVELVIGNSRPNFQQQSSASNKPAAMPNGQSSSNPQAGIQAHSPQTMNSGIQTNGFQSGLADDAIGIGTLNNQPRHGFNQSSQLNQPSSHSAIEEQNSLNLGLGQGTMDASHGAINRVNQGKPKFATGSGFANVVETPTAIPSTKPRNQEVQVEGGIQHQSFLNPNFTFESFVEGKSNQLAHAAAKQVAQNAGGSYNPLFIYGGVGLGKTHIMHAVGNHLLQQNPNAKILYVHSERFVQDMVKALQLNALNEFKRFYRSLDALLIDDIQFFANKEKSQEEFFHTFNALLEGGQQMILTCDRYPKEIIGLEERLKSRFGWGLTVAVEPPELETRVAILMKKAEQMQVNLPQEAAFFIAQKIRSNVRELEGALRRVIAAAQFYGTDVSLPLIKDALKDLLALQDKQISIENIQRTVAEYYKIKVADLLSKRRTRSVARPRQVAMALSKELTNHSLPEIGDAFGGRDHTTVLHACRKIKELKETTADIREDYSNMLRTLTT